MVRSESLRSFELVVARGGHDDRCSCKLCKLKREDGHSAGTLHQHGVAGANVGFFEKGPPRRECGARQCCGFLERQIRRNAAYSFCVEDHQLLQYSRTRSTKGEAATASRRSSIEPRLEEHRAHSVTDRDAGYAFSDSSYLTSTVREGDEWQSV